jgi:hypothetical protein
MGFNPFVNNHMSSKSIVAEPAFVKLAYIALPNVGVTLPVPEFPAQAVVQVMVRVGAEE